MEIKQIIMILIAAIVAGLVFIPIVSGMNVITYDAEYTVISGTPADVVGGAAGTLTVPSNCDGYQFTDISDSFDVKITFGDLYGIDFVAHSNVIDVYSVTDPTITFDSFTADTVNVAFDDDTLWINDLSYFWDSSDSTDASYSALTSTSGDVLFKNIGCTVEVSSTDSLSPTEQTLFAVMGVLVAIMIVWFVAKEFRDN